MAREELGDTQDWPEWCVRQTVPGGRACVWVLAPSAAAAAVIANHLAGRTGDWPVGPDVELEVFLRSEYPEHCDRGDFTFTIIDRPVRQAWLEKRMRAEDEPATATSGPPNGRAKPSSEHRPSILPTGEQRTMTDAQVFTIISSVIGVGIALAALIVGLITWVRSDVRRLETDLREGQTHLRDGQTRIETRLLAVEKEQARTSGLLEGLGLTGRATPDSQPQPAAGD